MRIPVPGHHLPLTAMRAWVGGLLGSGLYPFWEGNAALDGGQRSRVLPGVSEAQVWDSVEQEWSYQVRVSERAGCS